MFVTAVLLCAVTAAQDSAGSEDAKKLANAKGIEFFEKQIEPLLKRRCYQCHSHDAGKAKGGLVLDSRHGWQKGGSEGAAIIPGKPAKSLL
ncbi:MAG: hypothetical protein GY888_06310, partial [Planctomycetaceae bacterium]|nr:hypothetical protein [Planctomycetaceae bacterium]